MSSRDALCYAPPSHITDSVAFYYILLQNATFPAYPNHLPVLVILEARHPFIVTVFAISFDDWLFGRLEFVV